MSLKMQFCICLVSESNSPLIKSIASGLSFIGILFLFLFSSSAITDAARILCLIAHTLLASDQPLLGGKTSTLQWKRRLKHCNERAQVSIWETILLPGQVKVGFKAVGRSCSNRKGFSTLYFFFLPCIFFLPVFFSSFHPVFLFSHRVFPSYWSLAVAMPRPNLEGEGEYQPKKQKFLSLSLKNHFFQKLSLCSFLMDSSSRQQCPWGEETELWPQLKSQNQKHFTPRPIFRALHKVFDNSSVREEVGGRVKINRLDK